MSNLSIEGQAETSHKSISIRTSTWRRLCRYGTYGSRLDSTLVGILNRLEGKETGPEERSF